MTPAGQGKNWSLWEIAGVLKSKTGAEANGIEIVGLKMIVKSHENPCGFRGCLKMLGFVWVYHHLCH